MDHHDKALKARAALWKTAAMLRALSEVNPDHAEALTDLLGMMADWMNRQADNLGPLGTKEGA